ncbi:MAG: VWA domain-containing protein [Acidobacteria bacterium]|nr:VWA domain-containing protein [Acidobacteriota bacterium]
MKGIRNFRCLKSFAALLIVIGLASGEVSMIAAGQSTRTRRVNEAPQKKEPQEATKPDPQKPAEKKTAPEIEAEPIRINSNLVAVPVSVTDAEGNPVRNLRTEDFQLEEEGLPQQIQTLGEPGKTPIELALLFDVSRSVRNRFDFEREAAGRFLKEVLKPGDAVSVFSIGSAPKLSVQRTDNVEQAIVATRAIEPTEEATAFFDTVVKASRHLSDSSNPGVRRVMVVISDGEDTNSERFRLDDATRELQSADSLLYAINPSGPSIRLNRISTRGHEGMVRLATETGGLAFLPEKLEDLTQVFSQIAAELQAQYLLGYYSSNETNDGKFRRITVRAPKRPELRIRARKGYYAPKD